FGGIGDLKCRGGKVNKRAPGRQRAQADAALREDRLKDAVVEQPEASAHGGVASPAGKPVPESGLRFRRPRYAEAWLVSIKRAVVVARLVVRLARLEYHFPAKAQVQGEIAQQLDVIHHVLVRFAAAVEGGEVAVAD